MTIHYEVTHDRGLRVSVHGLPVDINVLDRDDGTSLAWLEVECDTGRVTVFQSLDNLRVLRSRIESALSRMVSEDGMDSCLEVVDRLP